MTHVSTTKKYRPHGAVSTTMWGCPQDEGPPHGNAIKIDIKVALRIANLQSKKDEIHLPK